MSSLDHLLSSYLYDLPESLISKKPLIPRGSSRLMVLNRTRQSWSHHRFLELPKLLSPSSVIVANNTRVMKSRLLGRRTLSGDVKNPTGGKVEFLLLEKVAPLVWKGMLKSSCKQKEGLRFQVLGHGSNKRSVLNAEIISGSTNLQRSHPTSDGSTPTFLARFDSDPIQSELGKIPLPPYLKRPALPSDSLSYQTTFSKHLGSVAAPTAGLHFTPDMIEKLRAKDIDWLEITHHIGLGTFRPVKAPDIRNHQMHEEKFDVLPGVASKINGAIENRRPVIAVGTTAVRTLESAYEHGQIRSGTQKTSLFISPCEHSFQVVDHLITNFHLPGSTLLMLVSAFAGREFILEAYREAILRKYRFFSYGDAMLIL